MNGEVLEKRVFDIAKQFNTDYLNVSGGVYYRGLRPSEKNISSYKEDIVIAFLTGDGTDIQKGTCLVNVYIPDVQASSGLYYADKERCIEVATELESFPKYATLNDKSIVFAQSGMIATFAEESVRQHFVSLKLEFKVLNNNY